MGIIVSLSGVDNAGKSTQSKMLVEHLRARKRKVLVTEFAFGYYLLRPIIRYLRKSTGSPVGGPVKQNKTPILKLWFLPAFIDIWIGYILHLRPLKAKNDVILCDRFYTDIWANLLYYGYIPDLMFSNLIRFLPKSDISFLILVDPKTGHGRINDEFPLAYYHKQIRIYKRLQKLTDSFAIDGSRKPDLVFREILDRFNKQYFIKID